MLIKKTARCLVWGAEWLLVAKDATTAIIMLARWINKK